MNTLIIKGNDLKPIVITCCNNIETVENQENITNENSFDIFFNWVNKYCVNYFFDIEFNIKVALHNRNLVKNIFETIENLSNCSKNGHNIQVNWYYNYGDFEMKDTIINFSNILKLPINIIEYPYN